MHVFSSHPDSMFTTASFLRIKDVILKEKPGSGNDLTAPPLLETDLAHIQTLLRSNHSVDGSIYGVSEHVACQLTVQSRGPSGSRRSNWATVGTSSARRFRTPRLRKKLPGSSTISKVVLNPLAKCWSDPSLSSSRITVSAPPSARTSIFLSSHPKCNTCRVLWYKLSYASVRLCGSSSVHEDQIRRFWVCKRLDELRLTYKA